MLPFVEDKNRPSFIDEQDNECLVKAFSTSFGIVEDGDDDERSTSTTEYSSGGFSSDDEQESSGEFFSHDQRRSTTISFNPDVSIEIIPHRYSLSKQERADVWMRPQEYERSRRDARDTADLLSAWGTASRCDGRDDDDNDSNDDQQPQEDNVTTPAAAERCFLGLEGYTTVGRTMRKSLRRRAAKVVHEEQYEQELKGLRPNVEKMALGYAKVSESASAFAWLRALKNQDEVRDYLEEEEQQEDVHLSSSSL